MKSCRLPCSARVRALLEERAESIARIGGLSHEGVWQAAGPAGDAPATA